jgi:hypothetical protein
MNDGYRRRNSLYAHGVALRLFLKTDEVQMMSFSLEDIKDLTEQ